jgi:hypothetical protein
MHTYKDQSHIPYTYLIYWSDTNMAYYGVRYAKNCHPSDFWKTYKTSSNKVSDHIKKHGDPDIIQIRKIFTGENRVLKARLWEHKVLRRLQVIKRKDFLNASDSKSIDPAASSKARTGVPPGNKGKPQPNYIKDKKRKPKPLVTCPHCNKTGGISVMTRWHFHNCGSDINQSAIAKIRETNRQKRRRPIVNQIVAIRNTFTKNQIRQIDSELCLKSGWYQLRDEKLHLILIEHQKFICRL